MLKVFQVKVKTKLVKSATVSLTETLGGLCSERKKPKNVIQIISETDKPIFTKMKYKYFKLADSIQRLTLTILRCLHFLS